MATNKRCRYCGEPIQWVEPAPACGWAHVTAGYPVMRFWCGEDEDGELRRVEPRERAEV